MRIVQLTPGLSFGDAVGNDALAIKEIISEMGYETEIYSDVIDKRLPEHSGKPIKQMPGLEKSDILLYHGCTGAELNFNLPNYGGKKVMIYHNITPPAFFHDYNPEVERIQQYAYKGMRFLADKLDYCFADSNYNKRDLLDMGFSCPIDVCPIIIPYADYDIQPDQKVLDQYAGDGKTNLLFVGRIVPNKKQEDVIGAFYCYQKYYNANSRLFIVGSGGGMEKYEAELYDYIDRLGIREKVIFPGHIQFPAILAYYQLAHVFVCMSEHEGFCVPLVEAMYFHKPIVAYRSSAIPDTLGKGGLLLEEKDPYIAAAAIDRLLKDSVLQKYISMEQEKVLDRFSYQTVKKQLIACLNRVMELQ